MRISDWSSDVCSSDLSVLVAPISHRHRRRARNVGGRPLPRPPMSRRSALGTTRHPPFDNDRLITLPNGERLIESYRNAYGSTVVMSNGFPLNRLSISMVPFGPTRRTLAPELGTVTKISNRQQD